MSGKGSITNPWLVGDKNESNHVQVGDFYRAGGTFEVCVRGAEKVLDAMWYDLCTTQPESAILAAHKYFVSEEITCLWLSKEDLELLESVGGFIEYLKNTLGSPAGPNSLGELADRIESLMSTSTMLESFLEEFDSEIKY